MTRLRRELGDATPVSALTADVVAAAVTAAWGQAAARTWNRHRPNVPPVEAVCLPATGRSAVDRTVMRANVSIVIDTREIESTADTTGETPAGRADGPVSLLAAVADPIRWTVLEWLATQPSCVCNLQEHVPIAANLLSYHLKVLREAGLVTTSRRGRWIDYALADDALDRLRAALPGVVASTPVSS